MKKIFYLTLLILFILSACAPVTSIPLIITKTATEIAPMQPTTEPTSPPTLNRGMNMGNMLEAPNEGEWGLYVQEHYFDEIKNAGFDFVRLPVRWNTHAEESTPYTIDTTFFARVDKIVNWAVEHDLVIIVDFHHYEEMMTNPWGHEERLLGLWKQVAEHYKDYPSTVFFEILNEPNSQLDTALWNSIVSKALPIIRETNPTRDVIIGPVNWNSPDWLSTLEVPEDSHLIATFHYYSPFEFTHQGAEWNPDSAQWLGTTWDATDSQQAEIKNMFDSVKEWSAKHNNIRILLGEFGAYSKAPQDSRIRWTDFIAREAERHGFAWAYWEFASGFGAYDPNTNQWREDLLKALIP